MKNVLISCYIILSMFLLILLGIRLINWISYSAYNKNHCSLCYSNFVYEGTAFVDNTEIFIYRCVNCGNEIHTYVPIEEKD